MLKNTTYLYPSNNSQMKGFALMPKPITLQDIVAAIVDNPLQPLIDQIEAIACGEDQVADNDGDGLLFIYTLIQKWKAQH